MATSTPASGELRLALDEIRVRENERALEDPRVDDPGHASATARQDR